MIDRRLAILAYLRVKKCPLFRLRDYGNPRYGRQYQCTQLPGKTRLQNDLLCVEWDVKPYTLTHCRHVVRSPDLDVLGGRCLAERGFKGRIRKGRLHRGKRGLAPKGGLGLLSVKWGCSHQALLAVRWATSVALHR